MLLRCLRDRLEKAIQDHGSCAHLVVAGGVAANTPIRTMLEQVAAENDMAFTAPPHWLCTDNAAMIACACAERLAQEGAAVIVADINEDQAVAKVAAIEAAGGRPKLVRCDTTNLKVTFPADLALAELILFARRER